MNWKPSLKNGVVSSKCANTSEEDLKKLIGSDLVINQAYEALNQFNWTEQELIAYEQELKRIRDNRAAENYLIES